MKAAISATRPARRFSRVALAIGAATLCAIGWLASEVVARQGTATPGSAPAPTVDRSTATPAAAAASTAPLSTRTRRTDPWALDARAAAVGTLRASYERAPDLRDFFERALLEPDRGGLFYARRALRDCAVATSNRAATRAAAPRSGSGETLTESTVLLDRMVERCRGLDIAEARSAFSAAARLPTAANDPLMGLVLQDRNTREPGKRMTFETAAAMVQRATDLGDPYFLGDSLKALNGVAGSFDGVTLDAPTRAVLAMASAVTPCDLGADCANDTNAAAQCYRFGDCVLTAQRIAKPEELSADERLFLVRSAAELTNAAREGTLLDRYGK